MPDIPLISISADSKYAAEIVVFDIGFRKMLVSMVMMETRAIIPGDVKLPHHARIFRYRCDGRNLAQWQIDAPSNVLQNVVAGMFGI